jgi:ankyrin repeat protein
MRIAAPALAAVLVMTSGIAIANKVDVDARRPDGSTSLLWAAFEGDVTEAARLLKAGADVEAANNYGINSLLLAADISNTELIQLLLKNGADANAANTDNETALHLVARSGNVEAAKQLVKAGAKVDAREALGNQTPLMWAIARRQPAMVEFLIGKGADINARSTIRDYQRVATAESRLKLPDRGGFTPLLYAARENCRECVELLLKSKVDVELPDPSAMSPLMIAMINGNWDIAKRLVESGADVNHWDMYGQSVLSLAIINMGNAGDRNPLDSDKPNKATGREVVQMLVDGGANPNQQTYFRPPCGPGCVRDGQIIMPGRGATPFLYAVSSGNIDLVRQLLQKGANPRLATTDGLGAIILAVGHTPAPYTGAMIGGQFVPETAAPAGAVPAAAAGGAARAAGAASPAAGGRGAGGAGRNGAGGSTGSKVELIKLLAAAGADVNLVARRHFLHRTRGGNPMHFAVRAGGNRQVIQALLEVGVDINGRDEDGLTALDYAMGRGYVPVLQLPLPANRPLADYLRSLGANVELERTPDWPPEGPPHRTQVYDAVIWPVDPVGP